MIAHAFFLGILGYDMHSLLDVIKDFRHIRDYCEDISPIVIAIHRNKLVGFIKTENFVPGLLLVSFSNSIFQKTFFAKFLFSSIKCTSFIPIFVKYSITYAWQHQPFRYNSWHVGNQCLNPDNTKLSLGFLNFLHYE
jgi:hypothetical protein